MSVGRDATGRLFMVSVGMEMKAGENVGMENWRINLSKQK